MQNSRYPLPEVLLSGILSLSKQRAGFFTLLSGSGVWGWGLEKNDAELFTSF